MRKMSRREAIRVATGTGLITGASGMIATPALGANEAKTQFAGGTMIAYAKFHVIAFNDMPKDAGVPVEIKQMDFIGKALNITQVGVARQPSGTNSQYISGLDIRFEATVYDKYIKKRQSIRCSSLSVVHDVHFQFRWIL